MSTTLRLNKSSISQELIIIQQTAESWNISLWFSRSPAFKSALRGYSKTCVKQPLKNRQNKDFYDYRSLMKVESIAVFPLDFSAMLLTCIKW